MTKGICLNGLNRRAVVFSDCFLSRANNATPSRLDEFGAGVML